MPILTRLRVPLITAVFSMKTKLILFVSVIAFALFGKGCVSTSKGPPVEGAVKWDGHYYAVIKKGLTPEEARNHCKKLGGHLLIIETEAENKFIHELGIKNTIQWCHLGARRYQIDDKSAAWIWDNGLKISGSYQNFAVNNSDEPWGRFNPKRTALSILLDQENKRQAKWHTNYPTNSHFFICEWE